MPVNLLNDPDPSLYWSDQWYFTPYMYAVAASPELYSILVQTGAVSSILGMITHENTDISIATVGLLQEMTDTDTILEEREEVRFSYFLAYLLTYRPVHLT